MINIHVVLPFCRFHYQHDTRRRDAMRGVHKLCGIWTIVGSFNTETRTNTYVCMWGYSSPLRYLHSRLFSLIVRHTMLRYLWLIFESNLTMFLLS